MSLDRSKRHKLTIVAGAGASRPFLSVEDNPLSTQLIAEALNDDDLWRDVWRKFDCQLKIRNAASYPVRVVDRLELDEVLVLRNMLLSTLTGTRFCESNFEYLIHLIDKASYYLAAPSTDETVQLDALLLAIEDTLRVQFPKTELAGWMYVPWLSREIVLTTALRAWSELQDPRRDEALALHRKFLMTAIQLYDEVRIYSLNYDPLLLEAIRTLSGYGTGFVNSGVFNPCRFGTDRGTLALFHGSVAFVPTAGRVKVKLNCNYDAAQEERIKSIVLNKELGTFGMKGLHASTTMVTGLDKLDPVVLNPYTTYLHHFAIDTFDSDCICFIGLSFSDDLLKAFMTNLPLERPRQRIVVVDRKTQQDIAGFASSGDKYLFNLASITGDTFPSLSGEFIQDLAKAVGRKGFGKFTDRTWLYAKGTEDFYREAYDTELL